MSPAVPELSFLRVLHGLPPEAVLGFLEVCEEATVPSDTMLVVEGEDDQAMLFVLEGELEVFVGTPPEVTVVARLQRGDQVGEAGLLDLLPQRSASVRSLVPTRLLLLSPTGLASLRSSHNPVVDNLELEVLRTLARSLRETDRHISRLAVGTQLEPGTPRGPLQRLARAVGAGGPLGFAPTAAEVLAESPHFSRLPAALAANLSKTLEPVAFASGEQVVGEGDDKSDAWLIASGQIGVYRSTRTERQEHLGMLSRGDVFGLLAILDGEHATATCVAETGTWLYRIPRPLVEELLTWKTPAAEALRWGLAHALSAQLLQANQRLGHLAHAQSPPVGGADAEHAAELRAALLAAVGPS